MADFFKRFYKQVYINVIVETSYCEIFHRIEKKGAIEAEDLKRFEIEDGSLTKEIITYIEGLERKSPYSYISILNTDTNQGARSGCSHENMNDKVMLCLGTQFHPWSVYADATSISALQQRFKQCGIDFIFSPFLLIQSHFMQTANEKAQMFILSLEENMSIAVFKNDQVIFAKQVSLEEDEDEFAPDDFATELLIKDEEDDVLDLDIDVSIDDDMEDMESLDALDDIENLDDLDTMDDLDSIDSLDQNSDLEEFSDDDLINELKEDESIQEVEEELVKEDQALSGFTKNYRRFELISSAIHEFYKHESIETSFIETIYIASKLDSHDDLKGYLQDELFVDVTLHVVDINDQFTHLIKREINGA